MQVVFEIGVADLDLEGAVAEGVGAFEQIDKVLVGQMEVEARGVGANFIAASAEELVEGILAAWRRGPRLRPGQPHGRAG